MGGRVVIASVLALVAALTSLQSASAAGPWRELHRPLDLPRVAPGQACPVSAVDQSVDWESANIFGGFGIGPGPVYPGLPSARLRTGGEPREGGFFGGKVFWYSTPSYADRVLIRGSRLDGPGPLRFTGERWSELRMKRNVTVTWPGQPPGSRGKPSGVLIRASGCYGVQIDGTTFSSTVVFRASTP